MSVSGYSQISLKKTQFGDGNGVLMNEVAMDTISKKLIRFNQCLSENTRLLLELQLAEQKIEKMVLENDFLKSEVANSELQQKELNNQLEIKDKIHANDINFWKEKSKGKFRSFLLGTGIGALAIAIIMLI